ncbi:MAG: succinate dehydrogenase [Gemmatimonadetes bacterium]|nr:succinate dehydrogenase [Gemmatimonadota bacterium]
MATQSVAIPPPGLGRTLRRDRWWAQPLAVAVGLAGLGAYATWAIFQGKNFFVDPYLSPFYSPCLTADCPLEVGIVGIEWWKFSPAILMMVFILGFRATCYYYRKAYYRSYFIDPPACAVGEHRGHRYRGETAFPFILQNLHRYFLYLSIPILLFLWYDSIQAFLFSNEATGEKEFGMGVGTLVLLVNVALLTGYLLGCHSLRHLAGGKIDCFSCARYGRARFHIWRGMSFFNADHMFWAWTSLVTVCLADLYVRLVATGVIADLRIL